MKYDKYLLTALLLAALTRIISLFSWHDIWWDAGVYIGMGKHLFSMGTAGLWEHIRPPILPAILGFFWWIGLNPVILGRILEFILMLGIVYFVYDIGKQWNQHAAFIAAILAGFSPILFYLSFHLYTEIPAAFFVLLGIWLFQRNNTFLAGLAMGIAFLTKFPAGIFLLVLLIMGSMRARLWALCGFASICAPYFLINWIVYANPLTPLLAARDAISRVLGCNVLRYQEWYYYFTILVTSEIPLNVFALIGGWKVIKEKSKHGLTILLCAALPLLYFMQLHCRDYRYLALFYPFVALLAGYGLATLLRRRKKIITIGLTIITLFSIIWGVAFYYGNEPQQPGVAEEYYQYIENLTGEIWIANPITAAHTDSKLNKIYYPIYDEGVSTTFLEYLKQNQADYILLDNCGGGIICDPNEPGCEDATQELLNWLNTQYLLDFEKQHGRCWYHVYTPRTSTHHQ